MRPQVAKAAEYSAARQGDDTMSWSSAKSRMIGALLLIPILFAGSALAQDAKPLSNEQLDQLTAQVALYPDSLLAQLFMATTYPDQFAKATAWSKAHPDAKGDDAVKMVENEDWDPSVASMVAFPEVVITLGEKPEWVQSMGDAFLAQPNDVMNSVQRLRQKAQAAGNLKTNEQVKVSTQAPEPAPQTTVVQQSAPPAQVIVIEPAQPQVVYVPSYNPAVVYGAWPYPAYPPYYYPTPPGYWFSRTVATGIAWGVGIGISNALWGGCNWGRGDVNINVNRYNNINTNNRINGSGNANWNHNTANRATAYKGGDATRQNLNNKYQSGNREQYRGKDASRDASRAQANQALQSRGLDTTGSARERAQSVDRGAVDRGAAQNRAQGMDRGAAQNRAQSMDRDAARQRSQSASRDNALRGASNSNAGAQMDRGRSSQAAAQHAGGGGNRSSMGGGARPSGGGGGARPSGGGGGRGGGGGGGGRGGGGRR
jgi:hypothetical protein